MATNTSVSSVSFKGPQQQQQQQQQQVQRGQGHGQNHVVLCLCLCFCQHSRRFGSCQDRCWPYSHPILILSFFDWSLSAGRPKHRSLPLTSKSVQTNDQIMCKANFKRSFQAKYVLPTPYLSRQDFWPPPAASGRNMRLHPPASSRSLVHIRHSPAGQTPLSQKRK